MENDSTFVAPEGVYSIREEYKPSIVQTHSAVASNAAPYPSRVSTIVVRFAGSKGSPQGFAQLLGAGKDSKKDKTQTAGTSATKDREDGVSLSSSDDDDQHNSSTQENPNTPAPPSPSQPSEPHNLFSQPTAIAGRRNRISRPKHNIKTTSSTFVSRIQIADGIGRTLSAKQGDVTFLFYNQAKSFIWLETGSKAKEPLAKVTFTAFPTCHDVNPSTASPERLDIVIGFSTGDLVWLDPISLRYTRLNKQGCISNSPCTAVRWVPSSSTVFLAAHADGTIIVYDKERDDGTFSPLDPKLGSGPIHTNGGDYHSDGNSDGAWNPMDNIFVTMPPWHPVTGLNNAGKPESAKTVKNPVSHWRVSTKSIVDFVFSSDVKYVAAISDDGCLRVIDALAEQLVDCYASYFGSLTCVAWSPDNRFILTGGQDDLITIFSPWEQRVIARCQGHSSFVSAVAFDELRCDGRTYRFGSVGEDNKLILWDFSSGALHRPKLQASHQRVSMSSTISLAFRRDRSALHLPSLGSPSLDQTPPPRYHPAPSRNEIAVVQPVLIKQVESDLLAAITFLPHSLLTSTKNGHIKLWIRPLALKGNVKSHGRGQALPDARDLGP
ncbi:hypothetical protein HGRIS_012770 [Hohenbuehelia grisea]|uniref:WD40 repeat-like protein n=1 Tax=Hohenbuehelia grisea TaxID=104357 RepID=A0ABR3ITE9_9AGAR